MFVLAVVLVLAVLVVVALAVVGYKINNMTAKPPVSSYERARERIAKMDFFDTDFDLYNLEDVEIVSDYGYNLTGKWHNADSKKCVIIVHGFNINLVASMRYFELFRNRGVNVLMYNHRFHGTSGGDSCSMGYYEKHDLKKCIDFVFDRLGEGCVVGLHGESMGGATSIMTAAIDKRISFIVSDCAFADFYSEAGYQLERSHKMPKIPFLTIADIINRIRFKHSYKDVSPIKDLKNVDCPILFIHGDNDTMTKYTDSVSMHQAYQGKKQIFISEGARHGETIHMFKQQYFDTVYSFLDEVGF